MRKSWLVLFFVALPAMLALGWFGGSLALRHEHLLSRPRPAPQSSAALQRENRELRAELGKARAALKASAAVQEGLAHSLQALKESIARIRHREPRDSAGQNPATRPAPVPGLPANPTKDDLEAALRRLSAPIPPRDDPRRPMKIALLERILDGHPSDADAPIVLQRLLGEILRVPSDTRLARAAIEKYAPKIQLPEWKKEKWTAGVSMTAASASRTAAESARNWAAAREHWERVLDHPEISDSVRADALFWRAYTYVEQGDPKNAKEGFESLLDRYRDSANATVRSYVDSARTQLKKLEKD